MRPPPSILFAMPGFGSRMCGIQDHLDLGGRGRQSRKTTGIVPAGDGRSSDRVFEIVAVSYRQSI